MSWAALQIDWLIDELQVLSHQSSHRWVLQCSH
jgi:hypothetical protein